jgi:hypothetical protein
MPACYVCCADAKDDAASPRLTVLTTLTEQLEKLSKEGKVSILLI